MPQFPRVNRLGRVAYGFGDLVVEGIVIGRGVTPHWIDDDTVVYRGADVPGLFRYRMGSTQQERLFDGVVQYHAANGGRWIVRSGNGLIWDNGRTIPNGFIPALNPDGWLAYHANPEQPAGPLIRDGAQIWFGPLRSDEGPSGLSYGRQGIVWTNASPRIETYGYPNDVVTRVSVSPAYEVDPTLIDTPEGPWVLSHDDLNGVNRLLLYPYNRPMGDTKGILVDAGGTYFYPHGCYVASQGRIHVVWSQQGETVRRVIVPLETPRVDLGAPLPIPPDPEEPPEWPEEPEAPVGSQPYPDEQTFWKDVVFKETKADYAEANRPLDDDYPIWPTRTSYDIAAGLSKDASWRKHRTELRAQLQLPPLPL